MLSDYQDRAGFIHHIRNPHMDSSENPLTFTGTYYVMKNYDMADAGELRRLNALVCRDGHYRTTYVSAWGKSISHDDMTAWISALYRYGMEKEISDIRLCFPRHFQPWNLNYYLALKFCSPDRVPLFTRIMGELSCKEGHKTRGGNKIAKTDGKILALVRARALEDGKHQTKLTELLKHTWHPVPLPSNNKLVLYSHINAEWRWGSWHNVFLDYYKMDAEHPNVQLAQKVDESYAQ